MDNGNLAAVLLAGFPADLDTPAIVTDGGATCSWRELDRASARMADVIASLGLTDGARVCVQTEKSVEALALYLAVLRAGCVHLPLNTAYKAGEVEYFLDDAAPEVLVCAASRLEWMAPLAAARGVRHVFTLDADGTGTLLDAARGAGDRHRVATRSPDDPALILYTSGTTGRSKGALLTHGNLSSNAHTLRSYWDWRPHDVLLHALPIFHVHGLCVAIHGALLNGSRMIWHAKFDPAKVLDALPRATVFMGVPTLYTRLLAEPRLDRERCAGMRLFISGSAPLGLATFEAFRRRTGHTILERYGMSETVMLASNPCRPEDGERVGGTVGRALPGVQLRIVDEASGTPCATDETGAIQVKGPNVFSGYWRKPERSSEDFTADGWFRTGDLGKLDARGYLTIVGRSKDLIITGGYNVYPAEIERYLDELPGVAECAVIGVPHPDFGEAVVAVVVPARGAQVEEAALIAALKDRIAAFKVPKRVFTRDELPRNAMGKVQKKALRDTYSTTFVD